MPKIHRAPLPPATELRLSPSTSIAKLAKSPLLNALSLPELVVYLRLLGAVGPTGDREVIIGNADLYREPRTAGRALQRLAELKLIKIKHSPGRIVEVIAGANA